MMKSVGKGIENAKFSNRKLFTILIDTDKIAQNDLHNLLKISNENNVDFFFVGGSLITDDSFHQKLVYIKKHSKIPLLIFPGGAEQISKNADAFLLLSLLSGRNPDLLIGQHVRSAFQLKLSGLEIVSTAYLLIDGGKPTSVSYMSNTQAIPRDKAQIAVATALAAEQLGFKLCYLEAGSGAENAVPNEMITEVKASCSLPIIVGGGIRSAQMVHEKYEAGADMVVVGTSIENDQSLIAEMSQVKNRFNEA